METAKPLTAQEVKFVDEYLQDLKPERAAIAAGYSKTTARTSSFQWVRKDAQNKKPHVLAEIMRRTEANSRAADLNQQEILSELKHRIRADPRDLVELRRECCRFCYGVDFRYQETPAERRSRHDAHQALLKVTPEKEWKNIPAFDEMGGLGFNPKKPPVEDCPECFGDGQERVIIKDTRTLSPAAAKLYRGVKQTKDGIEVKMADADASIERAGKYFRMWGGPKEEEDAGTARVVISGGLPDA